MVDDADLSSLNEAQHVAASLTHIDATIPVGVAGECDECGMLMPRLVDGRCGFCRDGRRPPPERYAAAQARLHSPDSPPARVTSPPPSPVEAKETTMPNPKPRPDFQNIGLLAKGDMLKTIRAYAAEHDLSAGKAALALMERALAKPSPETNVIAGPAPMESITTADLLAELGRRVYGAVTPDTLAAVEARAVAAEARLAQAAALLTGEQARA